MATGDNNITNHIAGRLIGYDFETISITNIVKSLTTSKIEDSNGNAKRIQVTVEDAQIRYKYNGTSPTSSEGHLLNPMDTLELNTTSNIKNLRFIRKGTNNGKVMVTFER